MKKMGGRRTSSSRPRGGRPFGENSNSGRGFMTAYTRPSSGTSGSMKIRGKAARKNSVSNLKGRASRNWTGALDGHRNF